MKQGWKIALLITVILLWIVFFLARLEFIVRIFKWN
jgi:hypothetical protein